MVRKIATLAFKRKFENTMSKSEIKKAVKKKRNPAGGSQTISPSESKMNTSNVTTPIPPTVKLTSDDTHNEGGSDDEGSDDDDSDDSDSS